jgi:hypothetical protein
MGTCHDFAFAQEYFDHMQGMTGFKAPPTSRAEVCANAMQFLCSAMIYLKREARLFFISLLSLIASADIIKYFHSRAQHPQGR